MEPAYTPPPPMAEGGKKKKKKKGGGERNRRTKREPAYSPLSEKKKPQEKREKNPINLRTKMLHLRCKSQKISGPCINKIIKNIFPNILNKKVPQKIGNNLSDYAQIHSQRL